MEKSPSREHSFGRRSEPIGPTNLLEPRGQNPLTPVRTVFRDNVHTHDIPADANFELMQVSITVYGLNGIICRTVDPTKKTKRLSKGGGDNKTDLSLRSLDPNERGRRMMNSATGPRLENDHVPTTAIVSYKRNAFSSGTSLETFLPSLPLSKPMSSFGNTARYMASWPAGENSAFLDMDKQGPSTFTMTRVMKVVNFQPESKIHQVSSYAHETIDLGVCLGRSKDLISLGVATFAITGDEEGEVVMNLPIKLAPSVQGGKLSKSQKKQKKRSKKKSHFPHDPSRFYLLDDNATLRVGVRVLPQHVVTTAKDRAEQDRAKEERPLEEILAGLFDENLVLHLEDENSLIDRLVASQKKKLILEEEQRVDNDDELRAETPQGIFPGFFCGALTCSTKRREPASVPLPPVAMVDFVPKEKITKRCEAVVLPLTLMSSVSESTDGSEGSFQQMLMQL